MNANVETITINGTEYVRADQVASECPKVDGLKYVIVRCNRAGVFAGFLAEHSTQCVVLLEARRLWYWNGAASLSQLAVDGVSKPGDCKFPVAVSRIELLDAIEIIDTTAKAKASIDGVKIWKK